MMTSLGGAAFDHSHGDNLINLEKLRSNSRTRNTSIHPRSRRSLGGGIRI